MVRLWLEGCGLGLDLLPVDATEAALGMGREMEVVGVVVGKAEEERNANT